MLKSGKKVCWFTLLVFGVGLLGLSGCNQGPVPVDVSGVVTYQGEPVKEGRIFLADVNNSAPTGSGPIKDGHYQLKVLPGEKRVRINVAHKTGRMLNGPMGIKEEEVIDLIPPKYNINSTLVCTVDSKGEEALDFTLEQ